MVAVSTLQRGSDPRPDRPRSLSSNHFSCWLALSFHLVDMSVATPAPVAPTSRCIVPVRRHPVINLNIRHPQTSRGRHCLPSKIMKNRSTHGRHFIILMYGWTSEARQPARLAT